MDSQTRAAVFEWIEFFYNRARLQNAIGYNSPVDFETELKQKSPCLMDSLPVYQTGTRPVHTIHGKRNN